MPKIKTNRMARKKFRVSGTGGLKKAQAGASHNTGKKSSKRVRHLRARTVIHSTNAGDVRRLLPYSK